MVSRRKVFPLSDCRSPWVCCGNMSRAAVAMGGGTGGAPVSVRSLKQAPAQSRSVPLHMRPRGWAQRDHARYGKSKTCGWRGRVACSVVRRSHLRGAQRFAISSSVGSASICPFFETSCECCDFGRSTRRNNLRRPRLKSALVGHGELLRRFSCMCSAPREVVLNDVSRPRMGHALPGRTQIDLTGTWRLQSAYMEDVETG